MVRLDFLSSYVSPTYFVYAVYWNAIAVNKTFVGVFRWSVLVVQTTPPSGRLKWMDDISQLGNVKRIALNLGNVKS